VVLALAALVANVPPSSRFAAQTDPRLVAAVRLAQDGLSDSARAVAGRILVATLPSDSLYPEALYTMGLLAGTEQDRRLYLRRVVIDHTQSAWADDALLQLAQFDYAAGHVDAAVRQLELLLRDYPASPLTAQAALWGARAAGDRRDPTTACRLADVGLSAVGSDVELGNLLEFQKQRCQGLTAMVAESIHAAVADSTARANVPRAPATQPSKVPPQRRGGFYVQVSAVRTQAAANIETARIKRTGYPPVILKEGGLLKIRAGAFKTRSEAQTALAQIRSRLGGQPFLVEIP
jgi:hypothetical protein